METEELKNHLLANFNDGGTWEDADALTLTKHGALDVAEYFYNLGCQTSQEREREIVEAILAEQQNFGSHIGEEVIGNLDFVDVDDIRAIAQKYNITLTNPNKN